MSYLTIGILAHTRYLQKSPFLKSLMTSLMANWDRRLRLGSPIPVMVSSDSVSPAGLLPSIPRNSSPESPASRPSFHPRNHLKSSATPIPSTNYTAIRFELPNTHRNIEADIYCLSGQRLYHLSSGWLSASSLCSCNGMCINTDGFQVLLRDVFRYYQCR